jgi:putative peptidoglycan lipid II flippase
VSDGLIGASTRATVASIVGNAPGLFVPLGIAAAFGASAGTDAFFIAFAVSSFVANTFGAATQHAAIPFLVQARREERDVGRFIGEITAILLMLSTITILGANLGVSAYFQRWGLADLSERRLFGHFVWGFIPYVICTIFAGIYSGALNARHSYVAVAMSPALRSVIVLAALLMTPVIGVYSLIAGYLAGELARVVYLVNRLKKEQRIRYVVWPTRSDTREFLKSALAQVVGSGVLALVPVFDRIMAAGLGPGAVSLLDYADRLWQVPLGFAMSGLMVTTLSHWSERLYGGGSIRSLSSETGRLAIVLFLLLTPLALMFAVYRQQVIALAFSGSKLTPAEIVLLADTLGALVVATPLYVAGLTYTRAFLVLKRSEWLLGIGVLQLAVKIFLNILLIDRWGLVGIGVATALTYAMSSVLLMGILHLGLVRVAIRTPVGPASE